jgi:hypothetical protein
MRDLRIAFNQRLKNQCFSRFSRYNHRLDSQKSTITKAVCSILSRAHNALRDRFSKENHRALHNTNRV